MTEIKRKNSPVVKAEDAECGTRKKKDKKEVDVTAENVRLALDELMKENRLDPRGTISFENLDFPYPTLLVAASVGHVKAVEKLIEDKSCVNASFNDDGATALLVSCKHSWPEITERLLKAGADVNATSLDGSNAIMMATKNGNAANFSLLINHEPHIDFSYANKLGETVLIIAAERGWESCVDFLLKRPNVNKFKNLQRYADGNSALHLAAENGYPAVLLKLLEAKCNALLENKAGITPVCLALVSKVPKMKETLWKECKCSPKDCNTCISVYIKNRTERMLDPKARSASRFYTEYLYPSLTAVLKRSPDVKHHMDEYETLDATIQVIQRFMTQEEIVLASCTFCKELILNEDNTIDNRFASYLIDKSKLEFFIKVAVKYSKGHMENLQVLVTSLVIVVALCDAPEGFKWLQNNYHKLKPFLTTFERMYCISHKEDEKAHIKRLWEAFEAKFNEVEQQLAAVHENELLKSEERDKARKARKREKKRRHRENSKKLDGSYSSTRSNGRLGNEGDSDDVNEMPHNQLEAKNKSPDVKKSETTSPYNEDSATDKMSKIKRKPKQSQCKLKHGQDGTIEVEKLWEDKKLKGDKDKNSKSSTDETIYDDYTKGLNHGFAYPVDVGDRFEVVEKAKKKTKHIKNSEEELNPWLAFTDSDYLLPKNVKISRIEIEDFIKWTATEKTATALQHAEAKHPSSTFLAMSQDNKSTCSPQKAQNEVSKVIKPGNVIKPKTGVKGQGESSKPRETQTKTTPTKHRTHSDYGSKQLFVWEQTTQQQPVGMYYDVNDVPSRKRLDLPNGKCIAKSAPVSPQKTFKKTTSNSDKNVHISSEETNKTMTEDHSSELQQKEHFTDDNSYRNNESSQITTSSDFANHLCDRKEKHADKVIVENATSTTSTSESYYTANDESEGDDPLTDGSSNDTSILESLFNTNENNESGNDHDHDNEECSCNQLLTLANVKEILCLDFIFTLHLISNKDEIEPVNQNTTSYRINLPSEVVQWNDNDNGTEDDCAEFLPRQLKAKKLEEDKQENGIVKYEENTEIISVNNNNISCEHVEADTPKNEITPKSSETVVFENQQMPVVSDVNQGIQSDVIHIANDNANITQADITNVWKTLDGFDDHWSRPLLKIFKSSESHILSRSSVNNMAVSPEKDPVRDEIKRGMINNWIQEVVTARSQSCLIQPLTQSDESFSVESNESDISGQTSTVQSPERTVSVGKSLTNTNSDESQNLSDSSSFNYDQIDRELESSPNHVRTPELSTSEENCSNKNTGSQIVLRNADTTPTSSNEAGLSSKPSESFQACTSKIQNLPSGPEWCSTCSESNSHNIIQSLVPLAAQSNFNWQETLLNSNSTSVGCNVSTVPHDNPNLSNQCQIPCPPGINHMVRPPPFVQYWRMPPPPGFFPTLPQVAIQQLWSNFPGSMPPWNKNHMPLSSGNAPMVIPPPGIEFQQETITVPQSEKPFRQPGVLSSTNRNHLVYLPKNADVVVEMRKNECPTVKQKPTAQVLPQMSTPAEIFAQQDNGFNFTSSSSSTNSVGFNEAVSHTSDVNLSMSQATSSYGRGYDLQQWNIGNLRPPNSTYNGDRYNNIQQNDFDDTDCMSSSSLISISTEPAVDNLVHASQRQGVQMSTPGEMLFQKDLHNCDGSISNGNWKSRSKRWNDKFRKLASMHASDLITKGTIRFCYSDEFFIGKRSVDGGGVLLGINEDGTELALKFICKNKLQQFRNIVSRFRLWSLNDQHILKIDGLLETREGGFLPMELCEYNLYSYLQAIRQKPCSENFNKILVYQLFRGVSYLHSQKPGPILHGGLKPSNVLLDESGMLRLADTGISLFLQSDNSTVSDEVWSNSNYWKPPECIRIAEPVANYSAKSDVFISGMLSYFILTGGEHPFGSNCLECEANVNAGTPFLRFINAEYNDMVIWMLQRNPMDRPTIAQVLAHPYFWTTKQRNRFLGALCQEMKRCKGSGDLVPLELEQAFARSTCGNWTQMVNNCLWQEIPGTTMPYRNTFADFIRFGRNLIKYYNGLSSVAQTIIRDPESYISTRFPLVVIYMYNTLRFSQWRAKCHFSMFF